MTMFGTVAGGSRRTILLLSLLGVAVVFGGGGRSAPFANLIVQLAAITCLAFSLREIRKFISSAPRPLTILVAVSLVLPLLHAVPLPPSAWSAMPGRDLVSESLQLIGRSDAWMPLSVQASLSLLAFIGLLPPLAVLVLAWRLPDKSRATVIRVLFGMAVLVLMVGSIQLASGGAALDLYAGGSSVRLAGTFANHNTTGLFLILLLCMLVSLGEQDGRGSAGMPAIRVGFGLILGVGVVLTQSRSSIALLLIPGSIVLLRLLLKRNLLDRMGRLKLGLGVALILLSGLGLTHFAAGKFVQSFERFEDFEDLRPAIWTDGLVSAERFWPVGSGMGTFDEVFQVDESLENVTTRRAGRAHNDYLEVAIEAGVVGLVLVFSWIVYLIWAFVRRWEIGRWSLAAGAGVALLCISAQSVVDYPLRNEALSCIAALLVAFLHSGDRKGAEGIVGD